MLIKRMKNSYYSLILDTATDNCNQEYLSIMIQYFDESDGVVCKLFALRECSLSGTAENLYKILTEELLQYEFAKNLIALVTDGAPVMNGIINSVLFRIKQQYKSIYYHYCLCHSFNLMSKDASKILPSFVNKFIKKVTKHFAHSTRRLAHFRHLREELELSSLNLLKEVDTRWLSKEKVVTRIVQLWPLLSEYFSEIDVDEVKIMKQMANPELKVYLQFLSVFLKKINEVNISFQKEISDVLGARTELLKIFTHFTNHILSSEFTRDDSNQYIDLESRLNLPFCEKKSETI